MAAELLVAQDSPIRWESMGGPIGNRHSHVIARRREILVHGFFAPLLSQDAGLNWISWPKEVPMPWVFGANDRYMFGDVPSGVIRADSIGGSWTSCGALAVEHSTGHNVTSIVGNQHSVYVSVAQSGLFLSNDDCETWTALPAVFSNGQSPVT